MLDKDKKLILFNFHPSNFGFSNSEWIQAEKTYLNIFESLKAGFDDSVKLIGMMYFGDYVPPVFEVIEKPSRALKQKIQNYINYIKTIDSLENITNCDEYNDLIEELKK